MKKRIQLLGVIIFSICLPATLLAQANDGAYKVVYEADKDGNRISGSLEELHRYINQGNSVRVGWELTFRFPDSTMMLTHWSDAGFISTWGGHVFAQIPSIYGQGPSGPEKGVGPSIFLSNAEPHGWTAIIGTTGVMRQKFKVNEEEVERLKNDFDYTDEQVAEFYKQREERAVKTFWSVLIK